MRLWIKEYIGLLYCLYEDGLDVQKETTPEDNTLQESKDVNGADYGQLRLSDMNTQEASRPPAAPGMKWARVTRTEQTMDE